MRNPRPLYLGLMSGTSADSIDAAIVDFSGEQLEVVAAHSYPFHDMLREQIFELFEPGENEIEKVGELDRHLGQAFASAALTLVQNAGLHPGDILAIGSHGQTIRHRPNTQTSSSFSLQIGDPNTIAEETGITTIADFRRRDIAAGGQGAPLTPAFHHAYFRSDIESRCILNIGGIANITLIPSKGDVLGFDTGPGNGLMDSWIRQNRGELFDRNGEWAASGAINRALLLRMQEYAYFSSPPPKSTGKEEFNLHWVQQMVGGEMIPAEDIQATLLELTATTIANQIIASKSTLLDTPETRVLACGGGTHNSALMDRLKVLLKDYRVSTTADYGLDPDAVEAVAFAWLAMRTMTNQSGNLPCATGASKEVVLGAIYPA